MNYLSWFQKFGKVSFFSLLILLVGTFLLTLLHYFDWIPYSFVSVGKLILSILSFFLGGFFISKNQKQKGYLEGMKYGVLFLCFMIFISFLFFSYSFSMNQLFYDLILLLSSMVGGMLGINFSTKK